jgi:hypothetical protein
MVIADAGTYLRIGGASINKKKIKLIRSQGNNVLIDVSGREKEFHAGNVIAIDYRDVTSPQVFGNVEELEDWILLATLLNQIDQESWYGVTIDENNTSPLLTRIAGTDNMPFHASLPVHSLMKGCLLSDAGIVNYYLKADDWTKKADGSASNLDGTDGQVMVEIPEFYYLIENPSSLVYTHKISLYAINGFTKSEKFYISAYEAAIQRSTLKLASVKNLTTDYRGGSNNAAYDGQNNTLLGKPFTGASLSLGRKYARKRGGNHWNVETWKQAMIIYMLYFIEYGTLETQAAFNANLTVNGYKQGGLGAGVTAVNQSNWNTYNGANPIIPCGQTDGYANGTIALSYQVPGFDTVSIPRYRGIENPFGHSHKWLDGASIFNETVENGGLSKFYVCADPRRFADSTETNYELINNIARASGIIGKAWHEHKAILIPREVSGTYLQGYTDSCRIGTIGAWSGIMNGNMASGGVSSGLFYTEPNNPLTASGFYGCRLSCMPDAPSNPRMIVLGDSLSVDINERWPYEISVNRFLFIRTHAISGQGIMSSMDAQVVAAANDNADIIICALGTNDNNAGDMALLKSELEENLIELKTSNPNATIYYMNVLPRWTNSGGGTIVELGNIRDAIEAGCAAQGITCWDSFTDPWITAADTADGVHTNKAGAIKVWNRMAALLP